MRGRRTDIAPGEATEKHLLDALNRLIAGKPTHPELISLSRTGKFKVSATTLAKEAQMSRTLFAHSGCSYPKVRRALQEYKKPTVKKGDMAAINRDLRAENHRLTTALRVAQSEMAAMAVRLKKKDEKLEKDAAKAERVKNRGPRHPYELPGPAEKPSATVIPIKPGRK